MNVDSLAGKLAQPFIAFLENLYNGIVYKAMLTLLPDEGKIPPHVDSGDALLTIRRCHLVVTAETGLILRWVMKLITSLPALCLSLTTPVSIL